MRPWSANPRWVPSFDDFPLTSVEVKASLFRRAVEEGWTIVLSHEPRTPGRPADRRPRPLPLRVDHLGASTGARCRRGDRTRASSGRQDAAPPATSRQRPAHDVADDAVAVDEELRRQAEGAVGPEDGRRPVEADGVVEVVRVGVAPTSSTRRLLDADGDDRRGPSLAVRLVDASRRIGISSWQGGHQVAQKFSQTGRPRSVGEGDGSTVEVGSGTVLAVDGPGQLRRQVAGLEPLGRRRDDVEARARASAAAWLPAERSATWRGRAMQRHADDACRRAPGRWRARERTDDAAAPQARDGTPSSTSDLWARGS